MTRCPQKSQSGVFALINLREHENTICLSREACLFKMLIHLSSIHLKVPLSIYYSMYFDLIQRK